MAVNVEVTPNDNENTVNLLRRFTKRVQGSGVLRRVRSIRYHKRDESKVSRKKHTIKAIGKRAEIQELIKWGKMAERPTFQRKRR